MTDGGPRGMQVLLNPRLNKATAFSEEERDRLGLRGLLPPAVCNQDTQVARVLENLRRKESDIERYIFLVSLEARNERLFYRTVLDHIEEIMPLIYTPTVGQACKEFAHIFRQTRGFYISRADRGRIRPMLDNWPTRDVRVIVVTDGERILGLGDLGANGMGIPIGKLSLYVACAGIHPEQCLPVMLDVGTETEELLNDPVYLGTRKRRLRGEEYLSLVDEFIEAAGDAFPDALIQFEDFATPNAFTLLDRYRDRIRCFNDDIQGTAAVVVAGIYAARRISGDEFADLRILLLGAGSANTGVAELLATAYEDAGLSPEEARSRVWIVDREGLITRARDGLGPRIEPFAQDREPMDFMAALREHRPQALIGATGSPGTFDEEVVTLMGEMNERPIVFALSNPTSRAECTAEQAYRWTDGRAVFASGSPFGPVELGGRTLYPSQGNNVYVYPGIGLGTLFSRARSIPDTVFLAATKALAENLSEERLAAGSIYPRLTEVRQTSLAVAEAVAGAVYAEALADAPRPPDITRALAAGMYQPYY